MGSVALTSTSPLAPIIWIVIVAGVVGVGVWRAASATDQGQDPAPQKRQKKRRR